MTAKKTTLITIGILAIILIWSGISDARYEAEVQRDNQIAELEAKLTKLESKKPQVITKTVEKVVNTEPNLTGIIAEWSPKVGFIICKWGNTVASGSFTLSDTTEGTMAMTNKHVLEDNGYAPNKCALWVNRQTYEILYTPDTFQFGVLEDYGYVTLNIPATAIKTCTESRVKIGDKLVVLGYPGIGSTDSITATEGIVSGMEENYYVTSAKIDHGNSGGAAILLKDNCYLGIPSATVTGEYESLGRILKARFVLN